MACAILCNFKKSSNIGCEIPNYTNNQEIVEIVESYKLSTDDNSNLSTCDTVPR